MLQNEGPEEPPDFSGGKDDHELYEHPSESGLREMPLDLDAGPSNQAEAGLGVALLS